MFHDALPWDESAGATHGDASGQVHSIHYGFLGENWIGGEDGDRDPIYEKGVWDQDRTECFVQIIFSGDVLLGRLRQLVVVCGMIAYSVTLGGRYGDGSVVIYRRLENASFPPEGASFSGWRLASRAGSVWRVVWPLGIF